MSRIPAPGPLLPEKKCQRGRERHVTKNDAKNDKMDLKWVARNDLDVTTASPGTESRRGSDGHSPGVISGTSFYVLFSRITSIFLVRVNNSEKKAPARNAPAVLQSLRAPGPPTALPVGRLAGRLAGRPAGRPAGLSVGRSVVPGLPTSRDYQRPGTTDARGLPTSPTYQ